MIHSLTHGNSQKQKNIKSFLSKLGYGNSTAIHKSIADQCFAFALDPSTSNIFFETLFEEIDLHASHPYAITKYVFILRSIVERGDPQVNLILRSFLPEIQTITMLTFETQKSKLRMPIHKTAQDIYTGLAYGQKMDASLTRAATEMAFDKPVVEEEKEISTPQQLSGFIWEDDEENEGVKQLNEGGKAEPEKKKEEEDLGPDPFDDFIGYDPFLNFVVPDNFSTQFLGIPNRTVSVASNSFF